MTRIDAVGVSWSDLCDRLAAPGVRRRWVQAESVLGPDPSPTRIAARVRAGGLAADELMGGLMRLASAAGGDEADAASLVCHLLAPRLGRVTVSLVDLPDGPRQIWNEVVTTTWLVVRSMPPVRRRGHVRGLLLDVHKLVVAWYRAPARVRPVGLASQMEDLLLPPAPAAFDPVRESRQELAELLSWATGAGVVTRADALLVWELVNAETHQCRIDRHSYRLTVCTNAAVAAVAEEHGVTMRTIRRRLTATLTALRYAAGSYLQLVA